MIVLSALVVLLGVGVSDAAKAVAIGGACVTASSQNGTCMRYESCIHYVAGDNTNKEPITACYYEYKGAEIVAQIVCCPTGNIAISPFRNLGPEGILKDGSTTCRFDDGTDTLLCCDGSHSKGPAPQPNSCSNVLFTERVGAVRAPPRPDHSELIMEKCMAYEDYKPCESELLECKLSDSHYRIRGGTEADEGELPFMALIGYLDSSSYYVRWNAGGALVSERFLLTAAHVAIDSTEVRARYALLGTTDMRKASDDNTYNIIKTHIHDLYDKAKKQNDIALFELDRSARFSPTVRPLCLPWLGLEPDPPEARLIAGWGQHETGLQSRFLKKALLEAVDKEPCMKMNRDQNIPYVDESMICARAYKGFKNDSCQGDSGGPLVVVARIGNKCASVVLGVVSHGQKCGEGEAGVYARVSYYIDWIVKRVWPK